jgi:hypothetical protein
MICWSCISLMMILCSSIWIDIATALLAGTENGAELNVEVSRIGVKRKSQVMAG